MSLMMKWVIALLVIIGVGAALWWSGWLTSIGLTLPNQNTGAAVNTETENTNTPTVPNDLPTAADDSSDQALSQDVIALSAQVSATAGDVTKITAGLSDKPIAQQATITTATMTAAKDKAVQEIDRRVAGLQELAPRVSAMTKITAELKTNINTVVQNQIQAFTELKNKINADTDLETLKTDVGTVTSSYRIYALIVPQANIITASDRVVTIDNMLNGIGLKLKTRIEAAAAAGADVTALATALVELGTKIDSANAHAQAAVNGVVSLLPDEGDAAKIKANTDALTAARGEITAAHTDIKSAETQVKTIISGLSQLQVTPPATE